MQELNKNNYFDSIKDGAVVVEFQADWCGDCRRVAPIIDKMQETFKGKVRFFSVNFSNEEDLKDTLNIRRIPTLIFYKNGQEVNERLIEPNNVATIQGAIEKIL